MKKYSRECKICDSKFETNIGSKAYCSYSCGHKANSIRSKERYQPKNLNISFPRIYLSAYLRKNASEQIAFDNFQAFCKRFRSYVDNTDPEQPKETQ